MQMFAMKFFFVEIMCELLLVFSATRETWDVIDFSDKAFVLYRELETYRIHNQIIALL
jgi:hypothetical protein